MGWPRIRTRSHVRRIGWPNSSTRFGPNLAQALATAKSWLSDEDTLQRLSQLTKVRRVHEQLDAYLKTWENHPLVISLNNNPPPSGLDVRIAQYEFHSMVELEAKISQFPPGTKFLLAIPPTESEANGRSLTELRTFLSSHGMIAAGDKRIN